MCGGVHDVHDVITGNKFHQNRSRGFRATGVRKLGSPIDLACRRYNSSAVPCWRWHGHYVFVLWFLLFFLLSFFFFPRLFPAAWNWMSTILSHMWPRCEFRMQVWNLLHAAHWKYRTQKIAKNSSSGNIRPTLSACIYATKAHIDNLKKIVKQQYLLHLSPQYGELQPISGWDGLASLGHPSKFQRFACWLHYCSDVAQRWPTKLCTMFGRLLHRYTIYTFGGSCSLTELCQVKNSLCF